MGKEISRMYQLYELRDEIKKAITNSLIVEGSQKKLVSILVSAKANEEFKDLIEGMKADWKDQETKRLEMKSRVDKLDTVIKMHEKQDNTSKLVNEVVTLVLEGLGAAKPQSKK